MIHARNTDQGMRFRVWSGIVDAYLTGEMTEEELRQWMREEAIKNTADEFDRTFPKRIAQARQLGTSSMLGDTRDLNGPWDSESE